VAPARGGVLPSHVVKKQHPLLLLIEFCIILLSYSHIYSIIWVLFWRRNDGFALVQFLHFSDALWPVSFFVLQYDDKYSSYDKYGKYDDKYGKVRKGQRLTIESRAEH
jgi:hypothetical protein